jgi:hypothetical protein
MLCVPLTGMNKLTRALACFLLAVLSFYIVPKEFVHALFGHEDTTDPVSFYANQSTAAISNQHTHCELLNFETDFFYGYAPEPPSVSGGILFYYYSLPLNSSGLPPAAYICLRGPPCC